MTNKRAREIISNSRFGKQFDFYTPDEDRDMGGITFATEELADWVLGLIEKDTAKDLIYEGDGYDEEGNMVYDYAHCPTCDRFFEEGCDAWGSKHCPDCGQKLDWSDEDGDNV